MYRRAIQPIHQLFDVSVDVSVTHMLSGPGYPIHHGLDVSIQRDTSNLMYRQGSVPGAVRRCGAAVRCGGAVRRCGAAELAKLCGASVHPDSNSSRGILSMAPFKRSLAPCVLARTSHLRALEKRNPACFFSWCHRLTLLLFLQSRPPGS